jgi:hypothetical protein
MNAHRITLALAIAVIIAVGQGCASSTGRAGGAGQDSTSSSPSTSTSTSPKQRPSCTPQGGSRCAGPEQISVPLTVSAGGRRLQGRFLCGGRLRVQETSSRVTVTYVASKVRPGGLMCAQVPLAARLQAPLGSRPVVDGVTGKPVAVKR